MNIDVPPVAGTPTFELPVPGGGMLEQAGGVSHAPAHPLHRAQALAMPVPNVN